MQVDWQPGRVNTLMHHMRRFLVTAGITLPALLILSAGHASAYHPGTWRASTTYSSPQCGSVQMSCPDSYVPRCRDREWKCFYIGDVQCSHNVSSSRQFRASVRDDPCWAEPPDCRGFGLRCTSEGWRCDPPPRRSRTYDYDDDRYDRYDDDRRYRDDRFYDDRRYRDDRLYDCRPWVACRTGNSSCPGGTYCGRYRDDYACIPYNCPFYRY